MEDIDKQNIKAFLDENDITSKRAVGLIYMMSKWLLDLIKDYGNKEEIASDDGQGFTFDIEKVRHFLGIKCNSEYYNYTVFRDYVLTILIQLMTKYGYNIKIREEGNPVFRFTLMVHKDIKIIKIQTLTPVTDEVLNNKSIMKEFEEICNVDIEAGGNENLDNIIEMCKYTDKLQKYEWNTEAVSRALNVLHNKNINREEVDLEVKAKTAVDDNVIGKHWSDEFRDRMIDVWQCDYATKYGDIPDKGIAMDIFAPAMYKIALEEFPEDIKNHSKNKDGSARSEKAIINLIYFRYKHWIEMPNKEAVKFGKALPFGKKEVETSIPFVQVVTDNGVSLIDSESNITTTAQAPLNKYNVVIKYKMSNSIFAKWNIFTNKFTGFNEVQAYIKALEELILSVDDINRIKIDNKSTTVTLLN